MNRSTASYSNSGVGNMTPIVDNRLPAAIAPLVHRDFGIAGVNTGANGALHSSYTPHFNCPVDRDAAHGR